MTTKDPKSAGVRALEKFRKDVADGPPATIVRDLAAVRKHWKKNNPDVPPWLAARCDEALHRFRGNARAAHVLARAALDLTRHPLFEASSHALIARPVLHALAWDPAPALEKRAMKLLAGQPPAKVREILVDVSRHRPPVPGSTRQRDRVAKALQRLKPDRVMKVHRYNAAAVRAEIGRYRDEDDLSALFGSLYGGGGCMSLYVVARALGPQKGGSVKLPTLRVAPGKVLLVQGNLLVEEDVVVEGALVVLGDLTVGGKYKDLHAGSVVVAAGSLRAELLEVTGFVLVAKDVEVSGVVHGKGSDAGLTVAGTLTCRELVQTHDYPVSARVIRKRSS
jgi:hypothetical protein